MGVKGSTEINENVSDNEEIHLETNQAKKRHEDKSTNWQCVGVFSK